MGNSVSERRIHSSLMATNKQVEINVTDAWIRFIRYCKIKIPHGEVTIRIVNGEPQKLVSATPNIRFDKQSTLPSTDWDEV